MVELFGKVCDYFWNQGQVLLIVVEGKEIVEEEKFCDYYVYSELIWNVLLYCVLVLFCGCNVGVLFVKFGLGEEQDVISFYLCEVMIVCYVGIENKGCLVDKWLLDVCCWCWCVKVQLYIEIELFMQLCEFVEVEVIKIFGCNLYDLLLVVLVGFKVVMGIDLGICMGCKIVVVDYIGKLLEMVMIYLYELC